MRKLLSSRMGGHGAAPEARVQAHFPSTAAAPGCGHGAAHHAVLGGTVDIPPAVRSTAGGSAANELSPTTPGAACCTPATPRRRRRRAPALFLWVLRFNVSKLATSRVCAGRGAGTERRRS